MVKKNCDASLKFRDASLKFRDGSLKKGLGFLFVRQIHAKTRLYLA